MTTINCAQVANHNMLIYTLMLLSPFIEWLVIDMIAETSATKNNLSRDNLLWPARVL